MPNASLFAAFVGINAYPQSPLNGCVNDVMNIDRLLRDLAAQQDKDKLAYKPLYFVAPHKSDKGFEAYKEEKAIEPSDVRQPTFEAVTQQAFAHLKQAKDGDVCLFYYSGHGSHAEAPPEFWHTKPDRQNETLVCVDSRDPASPGARDILDKELAYLFWEALGRDAGKNVHCLVIMDCCHAGNNTRAAELKDDGGLRYRHAPASKNKIPLEEYIGFDKKDGFYKVANGKAEITVANYVHLAAARDAEQAQETVKGGLFTRKLVEALRQGGTAKSYRELVQNLTVSVNGQANDQNPVAYARNNADLDLTFLGKEIKPYRPSFEVQYNSGRQRWVLFGGALHGIVPSAGDAKTTVRINELNVEVEVQKVDGQTSLLDDAAMANADPDKTYQAVVVSRANPVVVIGLSKTLAQAAVQTQALKTACEKNPPLYFRIDYDGAETEYAYLIRVSDKGEYLLTKKESESALFKREADTAEFLKHVESVCKWVSVCELNNENTRFSGRDFEFWLETVEGETFTLDNSGSWDGFKSAGKAIKPGEEILLRYVGNKQPAYRFRIGISDTDLSECFIGALYLDPLYGIYTSLIDTNATIKKGGSPLDLKWNFDKRDRKTILVQLHEDFKKRGINEVTAYLKILVANQTINLERYQQDSLELDPQDLPERNRTRGGSEPKSIGLQSTESKDDWTVFTFPIRIVGPEKDKAIKGGKSNDFGAFSIEAPASFNANAYAATGSDLQMRLRTLNDKDRKTQGRSADEEAAALTQMLLPSESIWGDDVVAEAAFKPAMLATAGNGIQVLELTTANGAPLRLGPDETITIKPNPRSRSLSADGLEETIVPFGYDEESQLYFPVGSGDANGNIHIHTLPPPSAGVINNDKPLSRSIGSSVKLFFKKVFRNEKTNTLTLYSFEERKPWHLVTTDPEEMKRALAAKSDAKVLLLIHGIIGDMKGIVASLKEATAFETAAHFVLAYDYENLSTPIAKTAGLLHKELAAAGFGTEAHGHKICIVAHSMGGLVTRCLLEKEGANYVQQAVMVGTPNGGSEVAALKNAAMGLLTHALNVTGPVKYAVTGLSFLLKHLEINPGKTLEQMTPDSDFMKEMKASQPLKPYKVIAGNTLRLTDDGESSNFFLKKLAEALKKKVVYPGLTHALFHNSPNDIAVTLESMKAIPGFAESDFYELASDHVSYFTENVSREKMLELFAGCFQTPAAPQPPTDI